RQGGRTPRPHALYGRAAGPLLRFRRPQTLTDRARPPILLSTHLRAPFAHALTLSRLAHRPKAHPPQMPATGRSTRPKKLGGNRNSAVPGANSWLSPRRQQETGNAENLGISLKPSAKPGVFSSDRQECGTNLSVRSSNRRFVHRRRTGNRWF